jgi:glycerol-1-phosphate dehydrogenase [NAD(P)+]
MKTARQVAIPELVRIKAGALDRLGIYARRNQFSRVVVMFSSDLLTTLRSRLEAALASENIEVLEWIPVVNASFEQAELHFRDLPAQAETILGFGGGKALDVAKYVAFLARLPYLAIPTSLSNDGFCSPQSSLTFGGRRRSLPAAMPFGVILDTDVCSAAPEILWHSGVGDLVSKLTAVTDWKLAFHACATPVDDFAALLSDATVFQFIARPKRDREGITLLGTALMLNGIAMALSGSSRPASGSEHLISHALDSLCARPRLHGLQVGVATYLISLLQQHHTATIAALFETTGFWQAVASDPFSKAEWKAAFAKAPSIKDNFYTVLSSRDCVPELIKFLEHDPLLARCFVD